MKILLIGGHGLLGTELVNLDKHILAPTKGQLNIQCVEDIASSLLASKPDIIINSAAIKDNRKIEQDPQEAIGINIIGSAYLANACFQENIRYVYISTDYIYKGDRGNYLETDEILPFNAYAWTKLGGECSARMVKNHLIIRTSFGPGQFDYPEAFMDKWSSKDYVNVIAPMILEAAISPLTGVINIGTDRKTIFSHAVERNPDVKPIKLADTSHKTPYDTSLNLQKWMDYKGSHPIAKSHTHCRACGSNRLVKYLDLGLMPLANNLEFTSARAREKERFPLQVMFCEYCGLSQLSVVIDPAKMFSYYTYRSGVNGGYLKHCREMAKDILPMFQDNGITHIDIAGNDGSLLSEFIEVYKEIGYKDGYDAINVDPATNLAAISEARGIETIADFWSGRVVEQILSNSSGADIITATNVFAHVDDIEEFLWNCLSAIKQDGIIVIEFPYLIDFIDNIEFDTVYFEHLSYMSVAPVNLLCGKIGLKIIDVSKHAIHGGTIRMTIAKENSKWKISTNVGTFIKNERNGYHEITRYHGWASDVRSSITHFGSKILDIKQRGFRIGAFAASAKGNTLLNCAQINTDIIDYIVDETPEKIGKFSPGTGIPIVNKAELVNRPVNYLVILSWNFKDEIMTRARDAGFKGKFIIPIPNFEVI